MAQGLANSDRTDQVRSFIERRQRVTVAEIADQFDVSAATVRRAIGALANRGEIRRVRGGALAVRQAPPELPVLERAMGQRDAKARIGEAAAKLVGDGETIFLGSGTTVLEVARHLVDRRGLTVLTNSLLVVKTLIHASDVSVIVLGGMLRRSELSMIGHVAELALQEVRATKIIMGVRAIHPDQGLMNDYFPETMTDRAVLRMGSQVIIVADHTKCGRVSAAYLAPVSAITTLITDTGAPGAFVTALEAKQVTVHRV